MTTIGRIGVFSAMVLAGMLTSADQAAAQNPTNPQLELALSRGAELGPVIDTSGFVFPVDDPDFVLAPDQQFKVIFGVSGFPDGQEAMNRQLDRVTRFINMHVEAGVPHENLNLAVMLYSGGTGTGLNDAAYREEYGVDNPNTALLRNLADAGVEIFVCAQSAQLLGLAREQFDAPARWAHSAMTVFAALDHQGYYVDTR